MNWLNRKVDKALGMAALFVVLAWLAIIVSLFT